MPNPLRFLWGLVGGTVQHRHLQRIARALRATDPDAAVPDAPEALEHFEDFQRFYRVSESDLRVLHRQRAIQVYFLAGCALFAAAFGVTSAWLLSGPAFALLAALSVLLFSAVAARHSLRAWQIRERRLGSFGEWGRRPRAWFPPLSF